MSPEYDDLFNLNDGLDLNNDLFNLKDDIIDLNDDLFNLSDSLDLSDTPELSDDSMLTSLLHELQSNPLFSNDAARRKAASQWPCSLITGKKLKWGDKGPNVIPLSSVMDKWPHDKITGKKLKWIDKGPNVITKSALHSQWPCSLITGKKLNWGDKGPDVIPSFSLQSKWPHDKTSGKKLKWGKKGPNVITYSALRSKWPCSVITGKRLNWGDTGPEVVTLSSLMHKWPHHRKTGVKLALTDKGEDAVPYSKLLINYTFIDPTTLKRYRGLNGKCKAEEEAANAGRRLSLISVRDHKAQQRRAKKNGGITEPIKNSDKILEMLQNLPAEPSPIVSTDNTATLNARLEVEPVLSTQETNGALDNFLNAYVPTGLPIPTIAAGGSSKRLLDENLLTGSPRKKRRV